MAGGSLHPHGELHKVNLERRCDNRRGVVVTQYLWACITSPTFTLASRDGVKEKLAVRCIDASARSLTSIGTDTTGLAVLV